MKAFIAAYNRTAKPGYSNFLGLSVHFAVSFGEKYEPLFGNYGMLFSQCEFNSENGISSTSVFEPKIFRLGDGYGIAAGEVIREAVKDGLKTVKREEKVSGRYVFWRTDDFCRFSEPQVITHEEYEALPLTDCEDVDTGIEDAEHAVKLEITEKMARNAQKFWTKIENTGAEVPEKVDFAELENTKAKMLYSDGSVHYKRVRWDVSAIDAAKPGEYTVYGEVQQPVFPFPCEQEPWGDPVITYYHGKYYYISTDDPKKPDDREHENTKFEIREADTPLGLFTKDVRRFTLLDYTPGKWESTFWAPEFHKVNGEMYIFCTLGTSKAFSPQSYVIKLRHDGDIMNANDWSEPYRVVGPDGRVICDQPLHDGKGGITLDMTYFEVKGRGYVAWSYRTFEGTDSGSMLMFAETDINEPWKLKNEPLLLSRPRYGWENVNGTDNNEGPHCIVTKDRVYMAYSGGAANGDSYVVGMLSAPIDADFCDMSVWEKSQQPWLASYFVEGQCGCGHNSFFVDEYGDTYIVYHGHPPIIGGGPRLVGIRRVHFDANGAPRLDMSEARDLKDEFRKVKTTVVVKQ